jgi:HK97 family phage major capsid protein/HK97 family phage prohead protease
MLYQQRSAPPPGNEPLEFVLSDGSVDRMGDVIEQAGWDLKNFASHPIALFNHNRDQIIGRWTDVRLAGGRLLGRLELAEAGTSALVDTVRSLVRQGIMRAVSVGFRALAKKPLGKDADEFWGPFRFTAAELLECSLVSVPANPNALAVAKDLPRDLIAELFRKPASKSSGSPRPVHGKSATYLVPPSTTMQTLSQRIQAKQQHWNSLRDRLAELSAKDDADDDEQSQMDELPGLIEQTAAELDKLRAVEKALAPRGNGDASHDSGRQEIIVPERKVWAAPKKKLEPADYVYRAAAAIYSAQANRDPLDKALNNLYGNDEMTGIVLRAAVNPAQTTVATWALELVQTTLVDFLDRLLPVSIYPQLAAMGVRYTFGNSGQIKIPVRGNTPNIAGNWVGEGLPKPVRRATFTTKTLTPTKLAVISTFTEEMATYSPFSIESIIRQAMNDDTAVSLDSFLIDALPASATRPAGLLDGVTPITASVLTPATAAMVADLKALVNALVAAGGGRNIAILMNPSQALSLGFAQTTTGDFLFSDRGEAANKFNVTFIVSQTVAAGRLIAVDAADFATVTGDVPRFAVSTEATIHEEDTTPLAIGTPGAPATIAAPTRSLFQTDSVAIRMTLYVNWIMRRPLMVQTIAAVTW